MVRTKTDVDGDVDGVDDAGWWFVVQQKMFVMSESDGVEGRGIRYDAGRDMV